ncbi:hypothetical protein AB4853_19670 [Bradyrhizobium sp. 1050_B9_N1_2]|uniref:hypothetical protein n=1 Tax=unclassified Bradyrhizobium TaxID=2631580 RepID=UPI0007C93DE2|nr:hypothetical protein [Bradyrhizobium sp.]
MPSRLFICIGLAISLGCVAYIATRPGFQFTTTLELFMQECHGDEECAQKLEAQRRINIADTIDKMGEAAIAKQDALKRSSTMCQTQQCVLRNLRWKRCWEKL